jgi:hypothetical protein
MAPSCAGALGGPCGARGAPVPLREAYFSMGTPTELPHSVQEPS